LIIKRRLLTILLILLSFVGQSVVFAYTPCLKSSHDPSSEITVMDHSTHGMKISAELESDKDVATAKAASNDCCKADCDCSMAGCVSAALPAYFFHINEVPSSLPGSSMDQSMVVSQIPESLYRPPIFR